ncbi:hypothetical protein [Micromonospora globispora]|uniref:hypothetical protein n=1 Tax=Micromonospora globispora TaxID=1450148 RepID=UPI0014022820|nr:hypothetical protein [Micromonospora globispora]
MRRHQREIDELNVYPVPDGKPGWYKEWPLWDCWQLDAVDVDALGAIVAERQAWIAASVSKWDAAAYLGWRRDEFTRVAKQQGVCCDAGARNPQDAEHGPKGSVNDTVHLAYTKLRAMIALRTQDKVRAAAEVLHPGRQVPARPRGVAGRGGGASGHGCSVLPSWGAPG